MATGISLKLAAIQPRKHIAGQRIKVSHADGALFYDIDADGRIYWLRPVKRVESDTWIQVKPERRRVRDPKLIAMIQELAKNAVHP